MKLLRTILLGIFVVAALAYLNIVIPQPQTTQARTYNQDNGFLAQEFPCNQGSCPSGNKVIKMVVQETPSCSAGTASSLAGYKGGASFNVENSSDTYKIHVVWGSYFCSNATNGSCTSGQKLATQDIIVAPGQWVETWSPARDESNLTCGKVQTDMSFQAYRKVGSSWVLALSYGNLANPGSGNATYTYCTTGKACGSPTPTPTATPTPTITPTPTVTPTPEVPTPAAQCNFSPATQQLEDGQTGSTTLFFSTQNLPQTNKKATICLAEDNGTQTYLADTEINYANYPISVNVTPTHTYTATVYLKNKADDSHTCNGTVATLCAATTTLKTTPTPTPTSGCTSNCGDINITVEQHQEQQQQQQQVLGASVAPAVSTNQLPSTGAGAEVLFGLLGLIPVGLKLRKFV